MISFDLVRDVPDDVDLVVEGVTVGSEPDDPVVRAAGFEAKVGRTVLLPGRLLVGLGDNGSNGPDDRALRRAAGAAARAAATVPSASRRPCPRARRWRKGSRSARIGSPSTARTRSRTGSNPSPSSAAEARAVAPRSIAAPASPMRSPSPVISSTNLADR